MRAEGTRFVTGVEVGGTSRRPAGRAAAGRVRRRGARRRRHRRPATCRPRAASSTASTWPWSTCRSPTRCRRRRARRAADQRRGQARRDHRWRRHRRRLPGHRAPPGRGLGHPAGDHAGARRTAATRRNPWPTYPMIMRVSSAHEEGGERLYSVNTERFLGDEDGQRPRAARCTRSSGSTAGSRRSRAPSGSCPPSWCCSPWASPAPSARGWSTPWASRSTAAATSSATRSS